MENGEQNGTGVGNGEAGIPNESKSATALDTTRAYINIGADGWVTATIHISKGLYAIIGFLAEVEDNLRRFYAQALKRKEEKSEIVKPGFRGFNLFKK